MHRVFDERRYLIPFRSALLPQIFTDVLVIGCGVAGMRAAIAASAHGDVILTHKRQLKHSSTYWAQGGVAAVIDTVSQELSRTDAIAAHIADTVAAGGDLCDESVVRHVVEQSNEAMHDLIGWDMPFDQDEQGNIALTKEGGHSAARILHADGDSTGKVLAHTMYQQVEQNSNIRIFDECFVIDLITLGETQPQCVGAITHHPKYGLQMIWASAVILATGGAGQIFRETTNPRVATGDGVAIAYRAGARLADLAFMQFHPTTLYVAGASRSLISEAVRGEGATLIDKNGTRFMPDYHELAELAPRDVVSRAILAQMAATMGRVYLDCREMSSAQFAARFPGIFQELEKFEIDPGKQPIPIHPSAHYMVGGVQTDLAGRTNIRGLYACGEVACTGLHGANRLASNSLLEGLIFGKAAGEACRTETSAGPAVPTKIVSDIPLSEKSELDLGDVKSSLRSVMWRHVGIERSGSRLEEVTEMFEFWARYTLDKIFDEHDGWEVQNMLLCGAMMTRAALWRQESRGTHYRIDFDSPSEAFRVHDVWQRGKAEPEQVPVGSLTEALQSI